MKIKLLTLIGLAAMLGTALATNEPYPNLVFSPDGHYDIGQPNTNRPGNLYLAGSVFASGPAGASYATTATAAGTTVLTNTSKSMQYFTGSTTQTVTLPVASTMTVGQSFTIENLSTGNVTIQSSGSNTVVVLAPNTRDSIRCVTASGTTAASWDSFYEATNAASGKVTTANNSITFAGTDGTTMTFPSTSATVARTDAANTFTGTQTVGALVATTVNGNTLTTGSSTFTGTAAATYTFPGASDTIVGVLTNPVQHVTVAIASADILALYSAPKLLVAAPASGHTIAVSKAIFKIVRTSTVYVTGGGPAIIQYGSTVHGAGTNACDSTIAATVITGTAGTSTTTRNGAIVSDDTATIAGNGIYLSATTGDFTSGTGAATMDIWYYVN